MKRKILAILLMLCMLLPMGVITAQAATPTVGDKLLDVDFEDWSTSNLLSKGGIICQNMDKSIKNKHTVHFSFVEDAERGSKVLKITDEGHNDHHPYLGWDKYGVVPGATYKFSGYVKRMPDAEGAKSKGYPALGASYVLTHSEYEADPDVARNLGEGLKDGQWTYFEQSFKVPFKAYESVQMYIRLQGEGEIYWDDLVFEMVAQPAYTTVDSGFFYYPDETLGRATVDVNTISYPDLTGKQVRMKLVDLDGETVLEQATFAAQDDTIEWNFPTKKMTKIGKSYTLRVEYLSGSTVLDTRDKEVYVYNRPKYLSKEGYIIDDDGNRINPVTAASLYSKYYGKMMEYGINMASSCHTQHPDYLSSMKNDLDNAARLGIKILVPMYCDMLPAGHPNNVQYTIDCIERFKNHDGLLGYMLMDEPFGHAAKVGGVENMYQCLQDSYKLIRQYDQEHLIYTVEANWDYVQLTANCVDYLAVDPYIGSKVNQRGELVSNKIMETVEKIRSRKPVLSLLQAWPWNGDVTGEEDYTPDANDIRSALYQSLIAGASGVGYFGIQVTTKEFTGPYFWDHESMASGVDYFNTYEWEDAQKAFITGEYPTFAQSALDKASAYWYKAFVKDNDLYVVVINRKDANTTISIPLTSLDGSVTIGNFTAVADEISGIGTITGNGTLSATLSPAQVVRFKLTVSQDLSGLTTSPYRDIYTSWAKSAIDTMYQAGVTNEKGIRLYAPEEEITRGDFAMFLVRTLGLTASGTANFADVNPYAEYADAIRIGKALGYLTAASGENYLPEEPISRADAMEILAQAMYIKETGGTAGHLSAYVLDMALSMRDDIPYTVDFAQNMSRAEAALVMQYILDWDEEDKTSEFASLSKTEISTVLDLFLSNGTTTNGVWKAEKDGMIAVYNKNSAAKTVTQAATVPHMKALCGDGTATLSDGTISGWSNGKVGTWFSESFLADETHTGGGAVGVASSEGKSSPFVYQRVTNLTPGKTYTVKVWAKTLSGTAVITPNYYNGTTWINTEDTKAKEYPSTSGRWEELSYLLKVPATANAADIWLRVYSGEVYFDDVTLWDGSTQIPLVNGGFETTTGGTLTLTVPAKTTSIFVPVSGAFQGVEKDNILYTSPIAGGVLRCPEDAWAAQYEADENDVKQLVQFYVNGDSLRNWTEELAFFRWDQQLRPIE